MDTKLIIRLSIEEKEDLSIISKELGITLSEYVRRKILGKGLKEEYLQLILNELQELEDDEVFTLKELLDNHWQYMSKSDKNKLLDDFINMIKNNDIPISVYKITQKGNYKFIKM